MLVLISIQILFEMFLFLRRINWDAIINVYWVSNKIRVLLIRFYWYLNFHDIFTEYPNIKFNENPNSGIRDVMDCQVRQTDMTKLIFGFCSTGKNWENRQLSCHCDLFTQIVHLKKAMNKATFLYFSTAFVCNVWKECKLVGISLISNFRNVLNAVCFLPGNSPASEFYMPTFWNTLSVPSS